MDNGMLRIEIDTSRLENYVTQKIQAGKKEAKAEIEGKLAGVIEASGKRATAALQDMELGKKDLARLKEKLGSWSDRFSALEDKIYAIHLKVEEFMGKGEDFNKSQLKLAKKIKKIQGKLNVQREFAEKELVSKAFVEKDSHETESVEKSLVKDDFPLAKEDFPLVKDDFPLAKEDFPLVKEDSHESDSIEKSLVKEDLPEKELADKVGPDMSEYVTKDYMMKLFDELKNEILKSQATCEENSSSVEEGPCVSAKDHPEEVPPIAEEGQTAPKEPHQATAVKRSDRVLADKNRTDDYTFTTSDLSSLQHIESAQKISALQAEIEELHSKLIDLDEKYTGIPRVDSPTSLRKNVLNIIQSNQTSSPDLASLHSKMAQLGQDLSTLRSQRLTVPGLLEVKLPKETANFQLSDLSHRLSNLENTMHLKASTCEIQDILSATLRKERATEPVTLTVGPAPTRSIEKLEFSVSELQKFSTETSQRLESIDEYYSSSLEKLQQRHKTPPPRQQFDMPTESPHQTEILAALRVVQDKLLEHEELLRPLSDLEEAPEAQTVEPQLPTPNQTESQDNLKLSKFISVINRHEAQQKAIQNQIKQLQVYVSKSSQIMQQEHEKQLSMSLEQLEELRNRLGSVMNQVDEGKRLSRKDFLLINELTETVNKKSDKSEITDKVDRNELNKTYQGLSRRIVKLQLQLKDAKDTGRSDTGLDPIMVKRGLECLACGQHVKRPFKPRREWVPGERLPIYPIKKVISI